MARLGQEAEIPHVISTNTIAPNRANRTDNLNVQPGAGRGCRWPGYGGQQQWPARPTADAEQGGPQPWRCQRAVSRRVLLNPRRFTLSERQRQLYGKALR